MIGNTEERLQWLAHFSSAVAQLLGVTEPDKGSAEVNQVKASPRGMLFKVRSGGRVVAAKVFAAEMRKAYAREVAMLNVLADQGLCPRILGQSAADYLIVMEWVEGGPFEDQIETLEPYAAGKMLGMWFAQATRYTQSTAIKTDWHGYLSQYAQINSNPDFESAAEGLRAMAIQKTTIAKNDGHLANFLWASDGALKGIDFEAASTKPYGWDILLTARTLCAAYPSDTESALRGLLDGWGQGTDCINAKEFESVVRFFVSQSGKL